MYGTDDGDSNLRHAKSTALVVGLKTSSQTIYSNEKLRDKINKAILGYFTSERVGITTLFFVPLKLYWSLFMILIILSSLQVTVVSNGMRACCYVFLYCIQNKVSPGTLLQPFAKVIKIENRLMSTKTNIIS
jgi:hypothetical protein